MARILITGFEPFGNATENPSRVIIRELAGEFETLLLPVIFGQASRVLLDAIDQSKPDVVIALGQAEGRDAITPERIAINCDDAQIPNNAGDVRKSQKIIADGADGYFSTLPLDAIVDQIQAVGVPAKISLSAGSFVCNHVFYAMQHHLLGRNVQSGFIHVPLLESQAEEFPGKPTMSLESMMQGIRSTLSLFN